jgi:hypothetical protein
MFTIVRVVDPNWIAGPSSRISLDEKRTKSSPFTETVQAGSRARRILSSSVSISGLYIEDRHGFRMGGIMPSILNLLLITVIVGLSDGQQLALEDVQFTGFIESREDGAVLSYRQEKFHGELSLNAIRRIDFGYERDNPFPLTVTLKSGQKLELRSARRDFVVLRGAAEGGAITIKHPDPIHGPLSLRTRRPNREDDLTIQYLEFPAN